MSQSRAGELVTLPLTSFSRSRERKHSQDIRVSMCAYKTHYVINEDGCWIWQLSQYNGYGKMKAKGRNWYAHVYYYELEYGPVEDGLVLDHTCRVTLCVNPRHLEPVTQAVNVQRSSHARLTPEVIRFIRKSFSEGTMTQADIRRKYGLATGHVYNIVHNRIWTNVRQNH